MMPKLIQTNFTYSFDGKKTKGSFLGRTKASKQTIRKFLTVNAKESGINPDRITNIVLGTSFTSQWIYA